MSDLEQLDVAFVAAERAVFPEHLRGAGDGIGALDDQPRCSVRHQRAASGDRVGRPFEVIGGEPAVGVEKRDVLAADHPQPEVARRAGSLAYEIRSQAGCARSSASAGIVP